MEIRKGTLRDIGDFISIYTSAYEGLEQYSYPSIKKIKKYYRWLLRRDEDGIYFAILDEPVGVVASDSRWFSIFENSLVGEIHELVVRKEYKGRGIGKKLIQKAEEYLFSTGKQVIELWVGETNTMAIQFYISLGYNLREKSWGQWIRMVKRLQR
jgi:ribosomal protein S18 acetylase RimI-like enzyme